MANRLIVTAALPYANGSLHLGHLVEYCQADMYVRALKRLGEDAHYICASDVHGTPIEVNAAKAGVSPEEFSRRFQEEHKRDFSTFDVSFDHFSTTHSPTNRRLVTEVYEKLREAGLLEDREMDAMWSEKDQRFLPDRFIKGTCPNCGTPDQYGDVCENCHSTYSPADLIEPRSVLSGDVPVVKKTTHVFFKLSDKKQIEFLQSWIDSGTLQPDQANYVRSWIEQGLQDWCISRDGPYFGFEIPDRPGKFFYVWLDAPLGYVASSLEWGEKHGLGFDDLWREGRTRIEHIIGKDIVYFHTLFWPAVLHNVGYTLPSKVHVHGMLTIDGKKMSKSRGTFINASVFAQHVEPQALRYYYACKYTSGTEDLDLSFEDFVLRINSELVNKHANLFSRAAQFLHTKLDGRLGDLPFAAEAAQAEPTESADRWDLLHLAQRVVAHCRKAESLYREREFSQVVRELTQVAEIGNELMQERAPWNELKEGRPEAARETCTFALNVCYALAAYLWPIVPRFCDTGARILGVNITRMSTHDLFKERNRAIGPMERLFERIDKKSINKLVAASIQETPDTKEKKAAPKQGAHSDLITFKEFQRLDLRVGLVKEAERVPKSDKLLKLMIDVGEEQPRQVVAGLGNVYEPSQLVGTRVVVVANLAPAKLMGVESQGMVLAGGEADNLAVLRLDKELPPGTTVR